MFLEMIKELSIAIGLSISFPIREVGIRRYRKVSFCLADICADGRDSTSSGCEKKGNEMSLLCKHT